MWWLQFAVLVSSSRLPTLDEICSDADQATLLQHFRAANGSATGRKGSIALVGSSGNLLFRGYGRSIDEHDAVIRVNGAMVRGYENDCGHDRHQVVVGWKLGLEDAIERHLLCCGALAVVTSPGQKLGHRSSAGNNTAVILTHEFMAKSHKLLGYAGMWPSTGFLALMAGLAVAQHLNARLSVYGFGACSPCNKYFDCDGSNSTDKGSQDSERRGECAVC